MKRRGTGVQHSLELELAQRLKMGQRFSYQMSKQGDAAGIRKVDFDTLRAWRCFADDLERT